MNLAQLTENRRRCDVLRRALNFHCPIRLPPKNVQSAKYGDDIFLCAPCRSRPPVEHKTIPVAASESEVDYDINLEEDE